MHSSQRWMLQSLQKQIVGLLCLRHVLLGMRFCEKYDENSFKERTSLPLMHSGQRHVISEFVRERLRMFSEKSLRV